MKIKRLLRWPVDKFVGWRYKKAGLEFGDACSYIHAFGKSVFFDYKKKKYKFWKAAYERLGYKAVSKDAFELVGGGWRSFDELEEEMWKREG